MDIGKTASDALSGAVGGLALGPFGMIAGALIEPRGLYEGKALALVRPGSTAEVASVLAWCDGAGVAVTPGTP